MADTKISDLTANTAPVGTEELVVNDSGTTKKLGVDDLPKALPILFPQNDLSSGNYFSSWMFEKDTSFATVTQNTLYALPFCAPSRVTITRIGVAVVVAVASTTIRLGIYEVGSDGAPGALVLDAGTVDSSSTGDKEITISQELYGSYYLGLVCQGGAGVNVRSAEVDDTTLCRNLFGAAATSFTANNYAYVTAAGTLPDPFGSASFSNATQLPICHVRVV